MYKATLIQKHNTLPARVMRINTAHGEIMTPTFMPVGTRAFVNCLSPRELENIGSQIILGGNTYHMLLSPDMQVIERVGGMHKFMGWHKPMLTDSGGYQVFSLSKNTAICKIKEDGAYFKHPISGKVIILTPMSSLEAQKIIGADIIMAFDQCTPETFSENMAREAMERTHRWLIQSKNYHDQHPTSVYKHAQALFGIIQGGNFKNLREISMEFVLKLDLDGIAIGGETIGYNMLKTAEILDWIIPNLPSNKPRYTMGVGLSPQDLIDVVAKGIDLFDCVAPTRNARHGALYHGFTERDGDWVKFNSSEDKGRILIKKSEYKFDESPILKNCPCPTCQQFSRAYLHYLYKEDLPLFAQLASTHNLFIMHQACQAMREAILNPQLSTLQRTVI